MIDNKIRISDVITRLGKVITKYEDHVKSSPPAKHDRINLYWQPKTTSHMSEPMDAIQDIKIHHLEWAVELVEERVNDRIEDSERRRGSLGISAEKWARIFACAVFGLNSACLAGLVFMGGMFGPSFWIIVWAWSVSLCALLW